MPPNPTPRPTDAVLAGATKPLHALTDAELERANQALMGERAAVLARQRDVAAEIEGRHKRRLAERLATELDRVNNPPPPPGSPETSALAEQPEAQTIGVGEVASVAEVFAPGDQGSGR